jgi:hypothetical protein
MTYQPDSLLNTRGSYILTPHFSSFTCLYHWLYFPMAHHNTKYNFEIYTWKLYFSVWELCKMKSWKSCKRKYNHEYPGDHVPPPPPDVTTGHSSALSSSILRFLNHTLLHSWTPLAEWSACHSSLYLHRTAQHINTRDEHPCPKWDSNSRSQQPSSQSPTPQTVWPPGLAGVHVPDSSTIFSLVRKVCLTGSVLLLDKKYTEQNAVLTEAI